MKDWAAASGIMALARWGQVQLALSTCQTAKTGWSPRVALQMKVLVITVPSPPCWQRRHFATWVSWTSALKMLTLQLCFDCSGLWHMLWCARPFQWNSQGFSMDIIWYGPLLLLSLCMSVGQWVSERERVSKRNPVIQLELSVAEFSTRDTVTGHTDDEEEGQRGLIEDKDWTVSRSVGQCHFWTYTMRRFTIALLWKVSGWAGWFVLTRGILDIRHSDCRGSSCHMCKVMWHVAAWGW